MKTKNVVLIGFMGCGKSTIGIKLSYRFRRVVEDTDKLIERRQKRSISDIFAMEGEAYFRDLETQTLKDLTTEKGSKIISVGGGTPVREENRKLLKKLGTVVYLRVQPETVCERLKGDTTRPLLQGDNPQEKVRTLMESRKDAYESCADLIIDVDDKDVVQIVDLIELYVNGEKNEDISDKWT